jgi:acetyltransferase-like isoleucine patch superfamily enzyme
MFFFVLQYFYRVKPILLGKLFKLFFGHKNLKIGKNFRCDSLPRILINKGANLEIGDNVIFRRSIEIRAHNQASIKIGNGCRIDRGVRLLSNNKSDLILEEGVRIGLYSVFNGGDSIFVGKNTLISGFVYLQTSKHNYSGKGDIKNQGYSHAPIKLEGDNWLGTHAVVLPGVNLGKKCIVGTSSVVNKSFKENSVIAGAPATLLKNRD